ncbi:amidohydrolase family protein [Nocardioides sp. LHD-245]|uniref:N-acyl-D-amino-acid deacylase family protein n=1 Tax=Nocardioides sp. LHD-245 TaxID=3051387 RepID=UPI0027DF6FF7|nr:amidohydrolase family protein [Nocardioides sp. LHD-245]
MSPAFDCVLTGGTVVSGDGTTPRVADLGVRGGRIAEVGDLADVSARVRIDCAGRTLLPGFVDAHSHAEGSVFDDDVQLALLRQGVTSLVLGQDGVSLAPGPGAYADSYFGALNGHHPTYRGATVADLLATYDGTVAVNVAYAVPLGTVRFEVLGNASGCATTAQMRAMRSLVEQGLADGAVGASSGLDYVPGRFAGTDELIAVVEPLCGSGGVYVTHMRGGYEENVAAGLEEAAAVALSAGAPLHVSHLHARRALVEPLLRDLAERGVDGSFDAYPYRRGFSLLAMPIVPEEVLAGERCTVLARLAGAREEFVRRWFPAAVAASDGAFLETRLAHVPAPEYAHLEGLSLREAAEASGHEPARLVHELLVATRLAATAVYAASPHTVDDDYVGLLEHPWHLAGSDGIFVGAAAHPRAWGGFARLLAAHTGEGRAYSLDDAAVHLSGRAARRFGLRGRGVLVPGAAADVVVADLARVRDEATYERPRRPASGIDTVLVNGVVVLEGGRLTGRRAGRALRRDGEHP